MRFSRNFRSKKNSWRCKRKRIRDKYK